MGHQTVFMSGPQFSLVCSESRKCNYRKFQDTPIIQERLEVFEPNLMYMTQDVIPRQNLRAQLLPVKFNMAALPS